MASIYPWPEHWWTNTGRFEGNDLHVTANTIFVPWATEAKPIASGNWTISLNYTAAQASHLDIKHNPFSAADETHQAGQHGLGDFQLSAGTNVKTEVQIELADKSQPLWTPQFQIMAGQPDVTFHRIEVYETPAEPGEGPVQPGELEAKYVRSWAHAEGTAGSVPALSATSEAGDIAVIAYASQWGDTAAVPPAGWTSQGTRTFNGRSGYIASLKVSNPSQTQNVNVTGPTAGQARELALLVVLKGVESVELTNWGSVYPGDLSTPSLVFSQQHATKSERAAEWRNPAGPMVAGGRKRYSSWSAMLATIATGHVEHTQPQGWAWAKITPAKPSDPELEVRGFGAATVSVYEPAGEVPARMRAMPMGYASISEMMATPGFLVAHRGGSASWPEMSMRAYTNAVAHGAGALEVSTHKTKDGIWVLAHDQNLQHVDPTAPETPIAQMTWAEVKRYKTAGEPILRIEDYLDAYGSTHVTVLDPKYSATQWAELALLLPTNAKDHVIWKSAGDATWLANQWRAAGWKCWGYAYSQHVDDGSLAKWAPSWDYVGLPYDATPAQWAKVVGLGKPVWAHICPNKAAYDQGLARGAVGCMVSGVADVLPTSVV